jgi:hypothetical protein
MVANATAVARMPIEASLARRAELAAGLNIMVISFRSSRPVVGLRS